MKFISYLDLDNEERLGLVINDCIYDFFASAKELDFQMPKTMHCFLELLPNTMDVAHKVERAAKEGKINPAIDQRDLKILAPVPHPPSCRDAYAFRQHVEAARRNRGMEMVLEFDQFPIFYFTNHNAIVGPGDFIVEEDHLQKLDFELEIAIVVGKKGRNISVKNADDYILGFTIMNDFSARQLQMEEMKLNLGPAKGKDFATAIGPWLVTLDELEKYKVSTPRGNQYNLAMKAWHNGKHVSEGNVKDMTWTFAEIIERASYGVDLYPGDVIGSGTVGTGCYLELNGTWARDAEKTGKKFTPVWLQDGDTVELEVTGLGRLKNRIVKNPESYSILAKKRM